MPAYETGRSHQQPVAQSRVVEIAVAVDLDTHQLAARPARDAVVDHRPVRLRLKLLVVDAGFEITLGLQVFEQVALALHQQAAVDGAFFIDRNQLPEAPVRDFVAGDVDFERGPAIDAQGGRHQVGFAVVSQGVKSHVRRQMVALLHSRLHLADAALQALLGELPPSGQNQERDVEESAAPSRDPPDRIGRQRQRSGEIDSVEAGAVAGLNLDVQAGFFGSGSQIHVIGDLGLVQPVGVQPLQHVLDGRLHLILVEQAAQLELGGRAQLLQAGRIAGAVDEGAADEVVESGDYAQLDAVSG